MTPTEFIESELVKRKTSKKDTRDLLEIFKKGIGIEIGRHTPNEDKLVINKRKYQIFINGVLQHHVPKMVFMLIAFLNENKGDVLTRDEILESVWGNLFVGERTIDVHILKVRKLLGNDSVKTIKGVGYKFKGI